MRCSDVIDVIVVTRRHVGGRQCERKLSMWQSEHSCAKLIRKPYTDISTGNSTFNS